MKTEQVGVEERTKEHLIVNKGQYTIDTLLSCTRVREFVASSCIFFATNDVKCLVIISIIFVSCRTNVGYLRRLYILEFFRERSHYNLVVNFHIFKSAYNMIKLFSVTQLSCLLTYSVFVAKSCISHVSECSYLS